MKMTKSLALDIDLVQDAIKYGKESGKSLSGIVNQALLEYMERIVNNNNNNSNQEAIPDQSRIVNNNNNNNNSNQETITDTKPDTEPTEATEPENELSEEVRETYRDMESFFNGEQNTEPSSFDSVNWDFD